MSNDGILIALAAAIIGAGVGWFLQRRRLQAGEHLAQQQKEQIRELETRLLRQERDSVDERNKLEVEHHERIQAVRAAAFEEGRQLGRAESQRDHVVEMTAQQATFAQRLSTERDETAREARERARAEFEMQAKLYDVSVRPYLKVDTVKGLIRSQEQVEAGYQYQLLVNGIPAFQPSVVIEETRRSSKVNEESINALLQVAERAAKAAAELNLGAGASVAKLGPAIIKRIAK